MKLSVHISRGIESLFGTRDENMRLLESGLAVKTRLLNDSLEIEGEEPNVIRAASILEDYVALVGEGHQFRNGDLNSYLRVVTGDATITLRGLVESGRQRTFGKKVLAPKTVNQRRYIDAIEKNDLVFGIGPAGTGKTYLAVAMAVAALLNKRVSRIILTRPAVEAGERLGFLPGTLQEKVDPYLRPLYDALYDMIDVERVEKLLEKNVIEVAPLAFMRGRTLNDSFIILDEAQNTSAEQMKMVLTRTGFNSKMVVTGDLTQIDIPSAQRSGLLEVTEVLKNIEGIAFVAFDDKDVVRHNLVQKIVRAYERYNDLIGANRQMSLRLNEPTPEAPPAAAGANPGPESAPAA
ncbi:MAG: PhoH family protein [Bryobacteraceae bacterium]|nr:PhoH family protein [Bryobacteraceae bacterium]